MPSSPLSSSSSRSISAPALDRLELGPASARIQHSAANDIPGFLASIQVPSQLAAPAPLVTTKLFRYMREAAPVTHYIRAYQPINYIGEAIRVAGVDNYDDLIKLKVETLDEVNSALDEIEINKIGLQTALLQIAFEQPSRDLHELNFEKIGMTPEIHQDIQRIKLFAKEIMTTPKYEYNRETKRFRNESGLMCKPSLDDYNRMSLHKHKLMRLSPVYQGEHNNVTFKGKIYADYLDVTKGKDIKNNKESSAATMAMARTASQSAQLDQLDSDENDDIVDFEARFANQTHIFKHAINAIVSDAPSQFSLKLAEFEPTSAPRPAIVEWADDDGQNEYVGKVKFDNKGAMEIILPQKTIEQYNGVIPKGRFDHNHKPHILVFTQELSSNLVLSRHKDTHYHHSTPNGGRPIRTGGEFYGHFSENDGQVKFHPHTVTPKSGHYHPKSITFSNFRDDLIASGLGNNQLIFKPAASDKSETEIMARWADISAPRLSPAAGRPNKYVDVISSMRHHLLQDKRQWV